MHQDLDRESGLGSLPALCNTQEWICSLPSVGWSRMRGPGLCGPAGAAVRRNSPGQDSASGVAEIAEGYGAGALGAKTLDAWGGSR